MTYIHDQLAAELRVTKPIGPGKSAGAKRVQEYLGVNGVRLVIDGDWGPATSRGLQMAVPGATTVDAAIMERLAFPILRAIEPGAPKATLGAMIAATAIQHLAAHPVEIGGQNAGPWVRMYMDGNEGPAWPWCMGFVTFVVRQAALAMAMKVPEHLERTYSCDVVGGRARKFGKLVLGPSPIVKPGDIFLVPAKGRANDWVHTGIIIEVNGQTFTTIEGNTNDEGSREGFEVCKRIRARATVDVVKL
ncbi:CHAP domain-containing protein [Sphingomonas montanisoli]|uniref:CHAP domain-containing protein n=1 Tax=Sphingomonas montanisoli TaxID=2606412 RepID=A0A5D9BX69_9SPHN|nr:CHAP domain-containing protein [Sphingomonas montanisoli]TZG23966.1 CHAP domain-containing protein [Sphingomonas montanisoli]